MCGIAGFWSTAGSAADPEGILRAMAGAVRHRGPDDEGIWWEPSCGIGLAHRRLSIIDLSAEGHQPMTSASGRYVMIYNGEVYNFQDIRRPLERDGVKFRGTSDTEVMLAAIERHGLLKAVQSFAGQFAFALFDRKSQSLSLVRDRLGEKPLYYGAAGGTLLFGSELKALRAHPVWRGEIDRGALSLFLRHNYVPAPYSIYCGISKVLPGTILTFRSPNNEAVEAYWSARALVEAATSNSNPAKEEEALDELDSLLRVVVKREMISDVPLGAFLSGGIDSSLIVALMQAQSDRPVRTFTIGFAEPVYNEAEYARRVAAHLGTDHTELYVSPADLLAVVPRIPQLYDEPFADSSQVPTFAVARLARQHVTVALSGDGGDEMFGGYDRYFVGERLRRYRRVVPGPLRTGVARMIDAVSPAGWDRLLAAVGVQPGRARSISGERLHKLAGILEARSDRAVYRDLMSHWVDAEQVTLGAHEPATVLSDERNWPEIEAFLPWMMYVDLMAYLPDDILVKVDRASMGVSLESRGPYLDHNVVEFAWRLPLAAKVNGGGGKRILRKLLSRYVPPALFDRPKMGFGVPLDSWFRGPLRDWAESLIEEKRLRREGYLAPEPILRKWHEHQQGSRNWHYHLWDVLMFQAWLEAQGSSVRS